MKEIVLAGAVRTPIGKMGGSLANVSAAELGDYVAPIPEPGSFALLGLGLAGLAGLRRRRQ